MQCVEILYSVHCAYRGNDDDQELLSLKLLHRAHLNVRQAHLTEKNPNLLTLKPNDELRASLRKTTLFSTKALRRFTLSHKQQSHLLPIWGNNANVGQSHGVVELLGQLAAVQHDLNRLRWVEHGRAAAFPHLCALEQSGAESLEPGALRSISITYPDSMEEERKAFFGQSFPLAQRLDYGLGSSDAQLTLIEELGGQREQGLMGTVVVHQLSHLE